MKKIALLVLMLFVLMAFIPKKRNISIEFDHRALEKSLSFIPSGKFDVGPSGSMHSFYLKQDTPYVRVEVANFHISNHEVSNAEYLQFLSDLKRNDPDNFLEMLPDTLVWRNKLGYNEPFVELYLRHEGYAEHPVVGVSYLQATAYCAWLTEQYSKVEKRKHQKAVFQLPTKTQWQYAAAGGMNLSPFSWGGPYMQNKKGEWLAKFRIINQGDIGLVEETRTNYRGQDYLARFYVAEQSRADCSSVGSLPAITAPVISYPPNNYGLYNMCGNVEEFVREEGVSKGGSWHDTGFYLQIWVEEQYDPANSSSQERGFRYVMEQQ